tara:strand:- start:804 stop:1184 length:381 start_codon:yes stop_codon:yes gene_type:complete
MSPHPSHSQVPNSHNPNHQHPSSSSSHCTQYVHRVHALPELRALVGRLHAKRTAPCSRRVLNALESRLARARDNTRSGTVMSPFDRMNHCRMALERLDANGWKRSYHQRLFHEDFLVCFLSEFWCG